MLRISHKNGLKINLKNNKGSSQFQKSAFSCQTNLVSESETDSVSKNSSKNILFDNANNNSDEGELNLFSLNYVCNLECIISTVNSPDIQDLHTVH